MPSGTRRREQVALLGRRALKNELGLSGSWSNGLGSRRAQHVQLGAKECGEVSYWGWLPFKKEAYGFYML